MEIFFFNLKKRKLVVKTVILFDSCMIDNLGQFSRLEHQTFNKKNENFETLHD